MAEQILMLALSPTMESGVISKWVKHEGDTVAEGDVLCEVETDKAVMDYESAYSGTLLKILLAEGSRAVVGVRMAVVGKLGEDISAVLAESGAAEIKVDAPVIKPAEGVENVPDAPAGKLVVGTMSVADTGATNPVGASTSAPDAVSITETSSTASSTNQDVAPGGHVKSSPLARKLAQMKGLQLSSIAGSGPAGRVVKKDVEIAASSAAGNTVSAATTDTAATAGTMVGGASTAHAAQTIQLQPPDRDEIIPVSGKRKLIAARLAESMYSAPHYYLKLTVKMDTMLAARKQLAASGEKLSLNAFLMKFIGMALKKHPEINATWQGDTILRHGRVDIGLAVAQPDGLITPIIRDCGNKGIRQIDSELAVLVEKALKGGLKPDDYTGATFTVSNLGSFGIEEFTAIINPPGSAILAIGKIMKQQVVEEDDTIHIVSNMKLTLSCDHRVIDGAVGARFLKDLSDMMENPILTLL